MDPESKRVGVTLPATANSEQVTHNRKNRLCSGCLFYANWRSYYSKDRTGLQSYGGKMAGEDGHVSTIWSWRLVTNAHFFDECVMFTPAACALQAGEAWGTVRTKYRSVWSTHNGILMQIVSCVWNKMLTHPLIHADVTLATVYQRFSYYYCGYWKVLRPRHLWMKVLYKCVIGGSLKKIERPLQ